MVTQILFDFMDLVIYAGVMQKCVVDLNEDATSNSLA